MNCLKCNKPLPEGHKGFCEECKKTFPDKYHEAREYLWLLPGATAKEIADNCDCKMSDVMQWLREEKIEECEYSKHILRCLKCGLPIRSGELCDKCSGKANNQKSGYGLNRISHEDDRYRHF